MLEGEALAVFEQHIQGFLFFHFVTPRYGVKRYLDVKTFISA